MSVIETADHAFGQIEKEHFSNKALARAIAPLLLKAVEHSDGRYSFDNVLEGLGTGRFELWGAMKKPASLVAVAVTTVDVFPSGKRAYVVLQLGGSSMADAAAFFKFLPKMEGMARQAKCDVMQIIGRKGWERDLAGWATISTVYERELNHA